MVRNIAKFYNLRSYITSTLKFLKRCRGERAKLFRNSALKCFFHEKNTKLLGNIK